MTRSLPAPIVPIPIPIATLPLSIATLPFQFPSAIALTIPQLIRANSRIVRSDSCFVLDADTRQTSLPVLGIRASSRLVASRVRPRPVCRLTCLGASTRGSFSRSRSSLAGSLCDVSVIRDGKSVKVGASVGIALYPEDGRSAAELLQRADAAMYVAKQNAAGPVLYGRIGPV